MGFSAFDIIGPAMVGPSSSHTAGAVRIGWVARSLCREAPRRVRIELHGSFAATGRGHATDRALASGLLGHTPEDERLKDSLELAAAAGIEVSFESADLGEEAHPNTARLHLDGPDNEHHVVTGSSVGGGVVEITSVDGFKTRFGGNLDTLVLWHGDHPGYLAKITGLFACADMNIATIRTSRRSRGTEALTVIECDAPPLPEVCSLLERIESTTALRVIAPAR